jgi:hypothetical protein
MADRKPPRELEGVLFRNNAENPHPKAPGQWGFATIGGVVYRIAGWINTPEHKGKNPGQKYLKLKFEVMDPQPEPGTKPTTSPAERQTLFEEPHRFEEPSKYF